MRPKNRWATRVVIWLAIAATLLYGAVVATQPDCPTGAVALAGSLIAASIMFCLDRPERPA
jgi:hypothetical protein